LEARKAGFEAKIARCFAFIGPHLPLDAHFAAGNFIRDALAGGPIVVKGDGKSVRSYLYASDLAVWLWVILFQGRSGAAYNVGSAGALTVWELALLVGNSLRSQVAVVGEDTLVNEESRRYLPDVSRALSELGLYSAVSPSEAVRRFRGWLVSHNNTSEHDN
jgi:dTDP-glucose 4,6-dehydratase